MNKVIFTLSLIASLVSTSTAYGIYLTYQGQLALQMAETQELKSTIKATENNFLGYTAYTTYLNAGKSYLSGDAELITAKVKREESMTKVVDKSLFNIPTQATVAIWYTAEYAFGFDLSEDQYDVLATSDGIQILINKPTLVATPAITNLKHRVLDNSVLISEESQLLNLYQLAPARAKQEGLKMVSSPEIIALCEKNLIQTLRSFLAKQPGVTNVPQVTVAYKS